MATASQKQELPDDKNVPPPTDEELESFLSLLPSLVYGVNRILEDSAPQFSAKDGPRPISRKVILALLALGAASSADSQGKFMTTADLVNKFREWFVVSEESANSVVSKTKAKMLDDHQYISIQGGRDHLHLTEQGEAALRQILNNARTVVADTLKALHPEERKALLDFAQRMIAASHLKKPPAGVTQPPENS
jgi:hypothetical protein